MIFAEMFAPVWSTCRMAVHRNRRLIADGEENERERSAEHRKTYSTPRPFHILRISDAGYSAFACMML